MIVAKVDLGEKQACPECEKNFYDLAKQPAVCPYCTHSFDPSTVSAKVAVVAPSNVDEPEEVEEETEVDEDEAAAKELELDADNATFGGSDGDEGDDEAPGGKDNMDGFSDSDEEDEDSALDDEDDDAVPPTQNEDEEVEEVEI